MQLLAWPLGILGDVHPAEFGGLVPGSGSKSILKVHEMQIIEFDTAFLRANNPFEKLYNWHPVVTSAARTKRESR